MKWIGYSLAFVAGAVVGALVAREVAIAKVEAPVDALAGAVFGKGSYASGQVRQLVDGYVRSN